MLLSPCLFHRAAITVIDSGQLYLLPGLSQTPTLHQTPTPTPCLRSALLPAVFSGRYEAPLRLHCIQRLVHTLTPVGIGGTSWSRHIPEHWVWRRVPWSPGAEFLGELPWELCAVPGRWCSALSVSPCVCLHVCKGEGTSGGP